jgi:hypothetical protein
MQLKGTKCVRRLIERQGRRVRENRAGVMSFVWNLWHPQF